MSDFRGPLSGPGNEPPERDDPTGPPTGPVTAPVAGPPTGSVAEPVHLPAIEPVAEAASQPDPEPAAESPAERGARAAAAVEAVAESAAAPATEAVAIPAPEPLPEASATPAATPGATPAAPPVVEASPAFLGVPVSVSAPPPAAPSPTAPRALWPGRLRRAASILAGLIVGYAALVLVLIVAYRWVDPPRSALMIATHLTGQTVVYGPVPISSISSYLQRAVITSEDARFCQHAGVDWDALYEAMQDSRGGSTITMQTAKNLFLWSSRSYIRKAIEIPVALTIDAFWPKRRILEVYLNIAEWGPGIFGAEAASYYHFDKPASRLTAHEATLLAASLPNPIARDAGEPGRTTAVLASRLRARMVNSDAYVGCLGLRPMPRAAPRAEPKAAPRPTAKSAPKPTPEQDPWQTKTEPAFNPWQN